MPPLLSDGQELLGRYRIESYLNEGGMQQVFKAKDLSFDRLVALKVPKNDSAERRFDRSARLSARIAHPNVAKTLDYFEEGGAQYLIEELVDGIDLGRFLETYDPLDPHLAAHILHHLARALVASHRVEVIHRDLKPSNVLVSEDPAAITVKVTDFGIAKMAEEEMNDAVSKGDDSLTGSQTAMGALPYMAPEMIESSKDVTLASDIWALGALAYRMVSGAPPYGVGLKAVVGILSAHTPPRPSIWATNEQFEPLLTELWKIIVDCLSKDPGQRPTADHLAERCAALGYYNQPRIIGTITDYPIQNRRYGYIYTASGNKTVFFHRDSFFGSVAPKSGMKVAFAVNPGSPNERAYPVIPMNS